METIQLLGDEAIARGAIDSGIHAAYGYPGTPSTEIMEHIMETAPKGVTASWCSNEKTAYEAALGSSFAGVRSIVTMKCVGLNVAADPFMNSSVVKIGGGLVVAVADDPGMHSSQNEQDSRFFADFGKIPCLEPADQQEAYDMVREAFDLSERFHVPVMVRVVTRLAHARAGIVARPPRERNVPKKCDSPRDWILMPMNAKRRWHALLSIQGELLAASEESASNRLEKGDCRIGVVTTGLARAYYDENAPDLPAKPARLHIGSYPVPEGKLRALASMVDSILVIEEGSPFVERRLRGILPQSIPILGKLSGALPPEGELNPENVRAALGLPALKLIEAKTLPPPSRPPQLCQGCPHADTYTALNLALAGYEEPVVMSDIGCYTLGALPPYDAIESCVDMGASIGMARGIADAGLGPSVAVIGDSTFYHSGMTPLVDAVSSKANITLVILDNGAVAMTGCQETILPGGALRAVVEGLGVDPAHVRVIEPLPKNLEANAAVFREEVAYGGLSVVIAVRECLESARRGRKS
jgi:indolepyruvate ferredoxin oxidoreductase, alpha subunit